MNDNVSLQTDGREPDISPTHSTDADESVPVDIKNLPADPERVAQFRGQLNALKRKSDSAVSELQTTDIPESEEADPSRRVSPKPEKTETLLRKFSASSTSESTSGTKKSEHPNASEDISDLHTTDAFDTIPFLRTSTENTVTVRDITVAQASKSHATLIAQQIRDHVIDRILVSSSDFNAERTVTVQLSPRLLQDTEVQLTQNGTALDIRLMSQNKDSVQFLQQHQSDLQTYLSGELKTYRTISVRVPSSQGSSELSQPHDGRSRNRFEYQPADEEETA